MAILERYQKSSKKDKKLILDEFCAICGYSRKYAIRVLNGQLIIPVTKRGTKPKYTAEVQNYLKGLWHAMGRICSKRMKKALPEWLTYDSNSQLTEPIKIQLTSISPATIDRLLRSERKGKGRSTTTPSRYWYKSRIPIQAEDSHIKDPGFVTSDTVAHCGEAIAGSYAHSLTVTDLASAWTENRALWRKGKTAVCIAMKDVEESIPFPITGFKSDCGTEFINDELFKYFIERTSPVQFYRSRPYQKNDNCHVEQKNLTHVRRLFGYDRFDSTELVDLMNDIYKNYWNPLQNFFIPTMKLIEKKRVEAKIKKKFDEPKTPYNRVIESESVSNELKEKLTIRKNQLNPFELRRGLEIKLKIFSEKVKQSKCILQTAA